jgi:hypothetical protein
MDGIIWDSLEQQENVVCRLRNKALIKGMREEWSVVMEIWLHVVGPIYLTTMEDWVIL